ncbi:3-hydroxymyristoyl/3-hydroxydecanoyl-(acyl carrier protein) dehydratase [unidentified eubacterium SCB49]|nr:3-hydroxymyristoyl/3-hydroxydecanoyl-(acyl carrier protein) dehydratase [unidentified eubacterium SCB49]
MTTKEIISKLPYSEPFLFVDSLAYVNDDGAKGSYTFSKESYFYKGHFKDNPVTPGVILTECMAQIGLVCLGIYLSKTITSEMQMAFATMQVDYFRPVFPGERVTVVSEKIYFRFGKLKCKVKMMNDKEEVVATGVLSGMTKNT